MGVVASGQWQYRCKRGQDLSLTSILGQTELAQQAYQLYLRFKTDESAQVITGHYRRDHPEDNNESQAIHQHRSVTLPFNAPLNPGSRAPETIEESNMKRRPA